MKKKFLILTLCFTLIFSGLNYKKSYADAGIISLPMLATVSALAVGTGIVIKNSDDLYDIGRIFYDYIDRHNSLTWETVSAAFSSVSVLPNNLVSVNSDFLDIVKGFFDDTFTSDNIIDNNISSISSLPYLGITNDSSYLYNNGKNLFLSENNTFVIGDLVFDLIQSYPSYGSYQVRYKGDVIQNSFRIYLNQNYKIGTFSFGGYYRFFISTSNISYTQFILNNCNVVSFPYTGGYVWDNVESKKENESVSLPIPGNLGQLVGQGSTDFWNNSNDLVGQGGLTLPSVDSPSISVDSSVNTFPNVSTDSPTDSPSVPGDGIWVTIKDFIISLVVPSDAFWTDTWGGLYNNFTNSFPMVDMDGFNDLVTGEKKFPNIDINIMGTSGRVVNGDVINSIVDWLRPIIAGFMMLCLMLFNYRKIYKLIRNSEPFGGIAPGTSDFSTGISEYSKQEVIKATDMVAEYRSWKERGGK